MSAPIILVGGGLATGTAVRELRDQGYAGDLVVIAGEAHAPYERPPLSKGYLLGNEPAEKAFVNDKAWYAEHDIDLRTLDDSTALKAQLTAGARIGIIGGGWIGLEVASAAQQAGAEVVVLEALEQPLLNVVGPEVGALFAQLHREKGVDVRTGVRVEEITAGSDGATIGLAGGDTIPVDRLVVGVGVLPVADLAAGAGIAVDNGILVDAGLRTSAPGVFAAGDVANVDHPTLGHRLRVEHWDTAIKHGTVAATNLLGGQALADQLPYFFTDQYALGLEYVGHPGPDGFDRVVVTGDTDGPVEGRTFRVWWLRGDRVVAGMHVNDWDAIGRVRELVGTDADEAALRS